MMPRDFTDPLPDPPHPSRTVGKKKPRPEPKPEPGSP